MDGDQFYSLNELWTYFNLNNLGWVQNIYHFKLKRGPEYLEIHLNNAYIQRRPIRWQRTVSKYKFLTASHSNYFQLKNKSRGN